MAERDRQVHADWSPGFRNEKHAAQWITTLETYLFSFIGNMQVANLSAADFAGALKPFWLTKPETASRVKQECPGVMSGCRAEYSAWRA
ncbi:phage integrase central domain-containing protein [Roseibium limicola]|uniref:phage integrase central domain-containing protein n=1 Tax=Roseibium limicola TaxID=2816037 RepID=UPI0038B4238F